MTQVGPCAPEDAAHLLAQSHALMHALFEPDSNHMLSLEALKGPDVRFFGAREGDAVVGCGALALRGNYGEVKSMFVAEEARGKGVASCILNYVETEAKDEGFDTLRLETGNLLHAAIALYERHGFEKCGPFGDYQACGDASVFMAKSL